MALLRFISGTLDAVMSCYMCIANGAEWLFCFDLITYFSVLSVLFCPSTPLFNYRGERLVKEVKDHIQRPPTRVRLGRAAALTLTR